MSFSTTFEFVSCIFPFSKFSTDLPHFQILGVEMLCVLHRVLLTRDSSDIQLTAMKVVRQIVKSAEESTSRYTKLFHPVVYLFTPKLFMNSLVYIFVAQVKAYMAAFFFGGLFSYSSAMSLFK